MAQSKTNLQPVLNAPETASDAPQSTSEPIRQETSLRAILLAGAGQSVQNKQAFMGDIRQKLAQVADEAKSNGDNAAETERLADTAATRLFKARVDGLMTGEELSGLLVDVFGAVPKQDGTPGKSPAGAGKTIRQRVVRAVQGHDYVQGGDGGRFFDTMAVEDVEPIITAIGRTKTVVHTAEDGTKTEEVVSDGPSIWTAYKLLGDIKSQGTTRLPFAFDPKKILGLQDALSEPGARETVLGNPVLARAYIGLLDQIEIINQVDAGEVDAIRAKLGMSEVPEGEETEETEDGEKVAA